MKNYEDFINELSGDYVEDLNAISDAVRDLTAQGESELADQLLKYGQQMIAEHQGRDDDFRSVEDNNEDVEKFYTLLDAIFAKVLDEDFEGADGFLNRMEEEVGFISVSLDALEQGEIFRSFQSMTEEILYRVENVEEPVPILGPETEIWLSLKGGMALELKRYDDAIFYLERAIKVNPMSTANRLSLSKVYRMKEDIDKAKAYNREAFLSAYRAADFSNCFSNEGYFLYKENRPSLALSCSMIAKEYDDENDEADGNLMMIASRFPDVEPAPKKTFTDYLKERKITGTISNDRATTLERLAEKAEDEGNMELAMDLYINLEALFHDDKYHGKLHDIAHKMSGEHDHDHDCGCGHHHDHPHDHDCGCGEHHHDHHHDHEWDCDDDGCSC